MKKTILSFIFLASLILISCSENSEIKAVNESDFVDRTNVMDIDNSRNQERNKINKSILSDDNDLKIRFFVMQDEDIAKLIDKSMQLDRLRVYESKSRDDIFWEIVTNNADFAIIDIEDYLKIDVIDSGKITAIRVDDIGSIGEIQTLSSNIEGLSNRIGSIIKKISAKKEILETEKFDSTEQNFVEISSLVNYLAYNRDIAKFLLSDYDYGYAYDLLTTEGLVDLDSFNDINIIFNEFKSLKEKISNINVRVLIVNNDFNKQYNYNSALVIDKFDKFQKNDRKNSSDINLVDIATRADYINLYLNVLYVDNKAVLGGEIPKIQHWNNHFK